MNKLIQNILLKGGVGVLGTDTIYGLVGSALEKKTVERIYQLRKRNSKKPMIILVSSVRDLELFDTGLDAKTKKFLRKIWPGKVSVILPCKNNKFSYLHRGKKSLAFRIPKKDKLLKLIKKTGPLVAPSANWEGFAPASMIKQAQKYFANKADFYLDEGRLKSKPSTLIEIKKGKIKVKREGAVKSISNLSL